MQRAAKLAGCTLWLAACQGPDYQAPGTDGLAPSAVHIQGFVRSNGQVAQIEATIFDGQLRTLTGGDSLVLSAPDGATRALEPSGYAYLAQITTPSPTVTLELVRRDGTRHPTRFELPPAFSITAPTATSRAAPMVATWQAEPTLPVTVMMGATPPLCSKGWTRTYPSDPGSVTVQVADFASVPGICKVVLSVIRETAGTPNGELTVTNVRLSQIRTLVLETQP